MSCENETQHKHKEICCIWPIKALVQDSLYLSIWAKWRLPWLILMLMSTFGFTSISCLRRWWKPGFQFPSFSYRHSYRQRDSNPWPELWSQLCGFIFQLVEHCTSIAEVVSSNQIEAIWIFEVSIKCEDHIYFIHQSFCGNKWTQQIDLLPTVWLPSSVGRALHLYHRGHGFESPWS